MSNLCFLFGFFGSRHEILKGAINAVFCRIFRQFVTDWLAVAAAN
jgi:DNA-binding MltR family transcriptional regulator